MLPRPSGWITVLTAGTTVDPSEEDQGAAIELIAASGPDGPTPGIELAEPIRMELVFRPYAFLDDGDVVTDARGRRWRFQVPFWWREPDSQGDQLDLAADAAGAPEWPLHLEAGDGEPDPERGARVAAATASGSHTDEMDRWRALAGAKPVRWREPS